MTHPTRKNCFGYDYRLHYSWEYRRFFDQNQIFKLSECVVYRIPNSMRHFRLGITLKARGTSIERNLLKRQIRESFRAHGSMLGSFDYNVVIPKHKRMDYRYCYRLGKTLRNEIPKLLIKSITPPALIPTKELSESA